jgi:hypothetical protein
MEIKKYKCNECGTECSHELDNEDFNNDSTKGQNENDWFDFQEFGQ